MGAAPIQRSCSSSAPHPPRGEGLLGLAGDGMGCQSRECLRWWELGWPGVPSLGCCTPHLAGGTRQQSAWFITSISQHHGQRSAALVLSPDLLPKALWVWMFGARGNRSHDEVAAPALRAGLSELPAPGTLNILAELRFLRVFVLLLTQRSQRQQLQWPLPDSPLLNESRTNEALKIRRKI